MTAKMNLDLANVDTPQASENGVEIELMYDGEETGWFVTVRGEMAPTVKKWQLDIGNKFRLQEWKEKRAGKNADLKPMTEEDLDVGLRGAAIRIVSFRGIVFGGAPFPFTPENAYTLVKRHPPFADQVFEASGDISRFLQHSKTSSSTSPSTSSV